jgi:NAD(P)-dependent dehydrogenase (short-subunit alcohol dehydrogenase family)
VKIAIVTGASRGIGRAIAIRLAKEGARSILCARDADALNRAVREIEKAGGAAAAVALDLRIPDAPARVADFALTKFGQIDIVVNNAGATKRGEFADLSEEDWADGFALKFFGAVRLTRATWPHLKASSGSIVNISGVGGRTPEAEFTIGGSVNAALLSFTKAMAGAGVRDGVQVNAISPGTIRTDRYQKRLEALAAEQGLGLTAAEQRFITSHGITRIGEPDDVAGLVAFIVSPEGRFLQGALIDMDGGATKTI